MIQLQLRNQAFQEATMAAMAKQSSVLRKFSGTSAKYLSLPCLASLIHHLVQELRALPQILWPPQALETLVKVHQILTHT